MAAIDALLLVLGSIFVRLLFGYIVVSSCVVYSEFTAPEGLVISFSSIHRFHSSLKGVIVVPRWMMANAGLHPGNIAEITFHFFLV